MRYILVLLISVNVLFAQRTVGLISSDPSASFDGYTLFAPISPNSNTYLIDNDGQVVNFWKNTMAPGQAVMLLEDGSLLRTGSPAVQAMGGGGAGGIIEKVAWNGTVAWKYDHYGATYRSHHDVEILPNGNILLLVWESHTVAEALAAGRLQSRLVENALWSERVIEVKPTGPTSGTVVWSWNSWDNLIQDVDPNKPNYGVVNENPDRIDINAGGNRSDWLHANSVRYNPERDEVMISIHNLHEVWIISRKSGKMVYRWGNPQNYKSGAVAQQRLWGQHDARWVPGNWNSVMIFNNGNGRPGGNASSVDVIELPVNTDGKYRRAGTAPYEPAQSSMLCPDALSSKYYGQNISGATMLPNGNTLTCLGPSGTFVEFTSDKREVWRYVNPVGQNNMIIQQGTVPRNNMVFKIYRYPKDYPAFAGKKLTPRGRIEDGPLHVREDASNSAYRASIDIAKSLLTITIEQAGQYNFVAYDLLGRDLGYVNMGECSAGTYVRDIPMGTFFLVRQER
ncbi:MAG: hypothetical protein FJ211_06495 [Ignavibacteria bacterium]|nr:hypothetical protein [Ignavibacteria bacterium]